LFHNEGYVEPDKPTRFCRTCADKAFGLVMDIQEFISDKPECNDMTVEDFIYYLLDFSQGKED
jgi:hypothetical protein